jgi:hypothetical protein
MKEYVSKASEPHFDDERTLLSARPVVPLEKIEAKVRHRRHWFLGGAFAIAMMLGAASALLASYLRLRHAPQPAAEVTQEVEAAPLAVAESAPTEVPVIENAEPSPEPSVAPKKEATAKRRTVVVKTDPEPVESSDIRQPSEQDQLHQIRDAVLYDEWQERRARRVLRHERRRNERYNHRDLSNLDEIFEGRPRPN